MTENARVRVISCSTALLRQSQHEVRKLIAGPSVYICDECVELCNDIIREEIREISPSAMVASCRPLMKSALIWMTM